MTAQRASSQRTLGPYAIDAEERHVARVAADSGNPRRGAVAALLAGVLVIMLAAGGVLSRSPPVVLATNSVSASEKLGTGAAGASACQGGELLPRGTTALRLSLFAFTGPELRVWARSGSKIVAAGMHGSGWDGATVTVPLKALAHSVFPVQICFASSSAGGEGVSVEGVRTPPGRAARGGRGEALKGRFRVDYLGPGHTSWLTLAPSVARRMGLGRAWSGTWVVVLVALLMLTAAALAAGLVLREPERRRDGTRSSRMPATAWACALVACLSAVSWSLITPAFEAPDEPDHFAYVKQLAETGTLPTSRREAYSAEETRVLQALRYLQVRQHPGNRAISSQAQQRGLEAQLRAVAQLPRSGSASAGVATSEPPLYYALESIPYQLASSGTLLERLQSMRLLSALMAGLTTLLTFAFLREVLPRARWGATVGALGVALSPLFGFMSGAVNPDGMLFAVSAALFYCLARAFRRGLTTRAAIATGLVIAVGLFTKLNFVGLLPGAFLALALLAARGTRRSGPKALIAPALAGAIGVIPILVFVIHNALTGHASFGILASTIRTTHGSLPAEANYIWQLYLPRLPGVSNDFPGLFTLRQVWFEGYVGRLGWLDTFFPGWVYTVALLPATLIVGLFARALFASRHTLRARLPEVLVYALLTLGLLLLVGADSYHSFPRQLASFGQARYLLPLLPLLGLVLALAARGAGRRWGPITGTLIVVLFLAHDLFSQLQVVARYYG